jgi:multiple sugar transport system substrate-binding protein
MIAEIARCLDGWRCASGEPLRSPRRRIGGGAALARRAVLGTPLALPAAAAAPWLAGCAPGPAAPAPSRGPVEIKLSSWNYRTDLVRANLDYFEQQNPDIKVLGPEDGPSGDPYRQRLNTQFLAGDPLDAVYMRDEDVAEWAEAKWIRALDDMPGAKELEKDEYPFVREQTHYKGKRYGTIYYVGPQVHMYNKEHLRQAGAAKPVETYTELRELALTLKRQRVAEFPFWGTPSEGLLEIAYQASGKRFFDEQLNPLFGKDPLFREIVEWHYRAYTGDQVFGSKEGVQDAFDNGASTFTWSSFYDLKRRNGFALGGRGEKWGDAAGQLMNAANPSFVPGKTGGPSIVRQYAVAAHSKHPREAWRLIMFLGGKDRQGQYYTAKRWWLLAGLGYGYKPLVDDAEIKAEAAKWGDLAAYQKVLLASQPRPGIEGPWSTLWRTEFTSVIRDVMLGKIAVKDGIDQGVTLWTTMRDEFRRARGQ